MRIDHLHTLKGFRQRGFSLIETIVFIVIVSIGLGATLLVFNQSVVQSVDPAVRVKALARAQALMDVILARKFDENTPTGGVPACDSTDGVACAGIVADADYDDVGDYNGFVDSSDPLYPVSVNVVSAGSEIGLVDSAARRIDIGVSMPDGNALLLSAYKVNF